MWLKFCEAEIFVIFTIKHQLAKKFVPTKISSSKNFLLTMSWGSQALCCQGADPVTRLKIDPCCRGSIKQTRKFSLPTLNSLVVTTTVNGSLELALSLLHTDSDPLALISSYYCFDVEIHTEFPGRVIVSVREIVGGVVRYCEHNVSLKIHLLHMQ